MILYSMMNCCILNEMEKNHVVVADISFLRLSTQCIPLMPINRGAICVFSVNASFAFEYVGILQNLFRMCQELCLFIIQSVWPNTSAAMFPSLTDGENTGGS